jgi:hypothetical protein
VEEVPFDAAETPQVAATTATTPTTTYVEGADDKLPVHMDPPQIRTRAETAAERRFAEEAGTKGI